MKENFINKFLSKIKFTINDQLMKDFARRFTTINNNNNNNNNNNDNKALHGQYPKILEKPQVDTTTTNKWLSSNLKAETEGLLVAAQDQAMNTRNYQKVICGQRVESKCRMCSQHEETVDYIVSGCEVLAKTEYISRHNNAAAYLH